MFYKNVYCHFPIFKITLKNQQRSEQVGGKGALTQPGEEGRVECDITQGSPTGTRWHMVGEVVHYRRCHWLDLGLWDWTARAHTDLPGPRRAAPPGSFCCATWPAMLSPYSPGQRGLSQPGARGISEGQARPVWHSPQLPFCGPWAPVLEGQGGRGGLQWGWQRAECTTPKYVFWAYSLF